MSAGTDPGRPGQTVPAVPDVPDVPEVPEVPVVPDADLTLTVKLLDIRYFFSLLDICVRHYLTL